MITITKRVETLVAKWPLIKQGLDLDLINLSSLARHLRPQLEVEIGERISEAAVLMALRRYQAKSMPTASARPQDFLGDMSLRGGLTDLTYANSPTLNKRVSKLSEHINPQQYLTVSRGLLQTSVIVHEDVHGEVENQLAAEHLETKVTGLTAITLHLKPGHDKVAGILAYPLNLFAWRGITVIELVSTFDELNIVLYDTDVEEAFRTLKHAIG
jgi:hypothetical protein